MGEFPEPAIRGSMTEQSTPFPVASASSSQPAQSSDPSSSSSSSSLVESETSVAPSLTPVTSKATTSFSFAPSTSRPSTSRPSTIESSTPVQSTTPVAVTTSIQPTSTTLPTRTSISQPSSSQVITPLSAPSSTLVALQSSSTLVSTIIEPPVNSETLSSSEIVTRPIITPTPSPPAPLSTTAPTVNSHLPFGAIVGIVAALVVILLVGGTCVILGPRRALRKIGIGANQDDEKIDYEEWERTHRESGTRTGRPASIGVSSDWWSPPAGAFPTRPSTVSMGGPGMAGVGAGRGMEMGSSPTSPVPRRMSQRRVEERGAVRSGWFAASMVRGASLLSLGSLVRPPTEPSYVGSERMSRMGTGGSAGKRFQELYRRERASRNSTVIKPNQPAEYLATVSELGEREPSGVGQRRAPGEVIYRPRSMASKVRQPSRLAMSYVPEIVVHDATLPNLSSVSSVTHESCGRGYDADGEVERYPRVF